MKDINVNFLRSQIGYVGQEPALFATSIENNIRYGKPDATREEIEEAAKRANAHDFIASFPEVSIPKLFHFEWAITFSAHIVILHILNAVFHSCSL